jgi:hypothetical protein
MATFSTPLPENMRRCLKPAESACIKAPSQAVANDVYDRKSEKLIHARFEAWLRLNEISFVHSRMDKKSTIREGWPDFSVFGPNGKTCFVEIKLPGGELSVDQMTVMLELLRKGHTYHICQSDAEAITWTSGRLGLG